MNTLELTPDGRVIRRGAYPELTWPAVLVGWLIGSMLAVAIGYSALILGFSIEGNELAAILGWGILRGIFGRSSIVENNINQTLAVSVNGASAGMMFTIPALFILADRSPEEYGLLTQYSKLFIVLACIAGGILGICFVVPLRKQMIDFNRLAYPGGIATASILKSPGAGIRKAILLFSGVVISAGFYLAMLFQFGAKEEPLARVGDWLNLPTYLNVTFFLSLMTMGVGFLSGRHGLVFGYGGFICYFVLAPLLAHFGSDDVRAIADPIAYAHETGAVLSPEQAHEADEAAPELLRVRLFRPVGIGILIGAAIGGIIAAFPLIMSAIRSMQDAAKQKGAGRSSDEMPIQLLYAGVIGGAIVLAIVAKMAVPEMELWRAGLIALLGTLWIWIAGVIVSESLGRTNWSPLSGMTLIAVTILIIACSGLAKVQTIMASVIAGAAICVAIAQAGGMMMDLKAGYLVGARPRMQQYAQLMGTWLGPILMIFLISVLAKQGFGEGKLAAPQATALASVIDSIMGGEAPVWRYVAGAGIGGLLAFSGLGGVGVQVGLGFYLPFSTVLTYTVGCLIRIAVDRTQGHRFVENVGIPIAAGLVVGESLVGVGNAFYQIWGTR